MNILAHVPLLIAFALVCGCSTPRAVKDLSKQNIQNAKRLSTEHAAAVDDYKRFVDFAEQQLETAALQIVEANKAARWKEMKRAKFGSMPCARRWTRARVFSLL